jgi:two-component system response regulator LytT
MNILITDDEAPARSRLRFLLEELGYTSIFEAKSVKEALEVLKNERIDVSLLDIQMPLLDGFDLVALLKDPKPEIIFVTAFDNHAIQAFEVRAKDYLQKPVRRERLAEALSRVSGKIVNPLIGSTYLTRVSAERANQVEIIPIDQCAVFYSNKKLVYVQRKGQKLRVSMSLDELEQRLDPVDFLRVHRGHIVNMSHIKSFSAWFASSWKLALNDGTEWDVARRRVAELKQKLGM